MFISFNSFHGVLSCSLVWEIFLYLSILFEFLCFNELDGMAVLLILKEWPCVGTFFV